MIGVQQGSKGRNLPKRKGNQYSQSTGKDKDNEKGNVFHGKFRGVEMILGDKLLLKLREF